VSDSSQLARHIVELGRRQAREVGKRDYRFSELGYVRRLNPLAVQPSTKEIVLQDDQIVILGGYEPVRGDRVIIVPLTQSIWGLVGDVNQDIIPFINKIPNNSLTADKLAPNSVGSSELANDAVDTAAIQDEAVTADKLAPGVIPSIATGAYNVLLAQVFS
jgi:hypothetical protein